MRYYQVFFAASLLFVSTICRSQIVTDSVTINGLNNDINRIQRTLFNTFKNDDSSLNRSIAGLPGEALKETLFDKVNEIQQYIQTDTSFTSKNRYDYLTGILSALKNFHLAYTAGELEAAKLPQLLFAFEKAIRLNKQNASLITALQDIDFKIARIIIISLGYPGSTSIQADTRLLLLHISAQYPQHIFPALYAFPELTCVDSLLETAARRTPGDLYTYSQATSSELGKKIHRSKDSLVQLIASLAAKKAGRLLFPFTGSLIRGELTTAEIEKTIAEKNESKYYKLLVKTQMRYTERALARDTAIAASALSDKIRFSTLQNFVYVINGLHDRPDAERFKVLEKLSAQELYYICVSGADELYTSSYLYIYKRIFKTLNYRDSYALLQSVHFDRFKRFIKLAANFNTLTDFLSRMNKDDTNKLMRSFAGGLQKSNSLEDAVDVADSYAAIANDTLKKLLITEVKLNLEHAKIQDNKTGIVVYGLLNTLFSSLDTATNVDISAAMGIPSVYETNIETLKNQTGKIIIQEYFYGDSDGITEFNNFLKKYRNGQWEIIIKKEWVELHSKKGTGIIIYANKPLDEITYQDERAQEKLRAYLAGLQQEPSIIIHRGHSYFVKSTISHISANTKIILLGSCGGYNNLNEIIKAAPFIHIIASKQEGSGSVNQPMIVYFTDLLLKGQNLYWPGIWKDLQAIFKSNKKFDDYVPPYKNLGAVFIMAFNKKMEAQH